MEYVQSGRVSEKTDTFAFGVILCELLTGKPPVNDTGQMLAFDMQLVLQQPDTVSLDERAGTWPRAAALKLARVAGRCVSPFDYNRCSVREVLPEVDVLAKRKPTPAHRTTVSQRPLGAAAASAPRASFKLPGAGAPQSCPHCGTKVRFRAGNALPCFTCKRPLQSQ